ncbi:MAG: hypothetical protein A2X13_07620 [Bacteroidetes bacterium GWC2_33_15]|nr:MAG: hypothetical protein A2X10_01475 [Bacteroidetes bacterium GWA2_33_15]OFX48654.1 MAG: hypothetical protein A2X13_07620 [Bacteroidetes bacterium GWC2_33_15]OFX64628.1 MAG: hypothetical protein A2X15_05210 [Bacteroidetes bacterium GWB2_32_14]OFX67954.1 MAG: hypothetical protein A2X14_01565 [Bacteroidetes bacterium GWD2_33_33]HAN18185.1 hypothetical protein [Bacteroidales bacterium]
MKIKSFALIIVLLFTNFTFLFSQKIAYKQFSLVNYDLKISDEFRAEISGLDSYINSIKVYNEQKNDKLKSVLVHTIYFTIKEELEKQLKIDILPANTFLNKVKYDDFGYPLSNIREAMRKGDSPYYIKIAVNIESITNKQKELNPEMFNDISFSPIVPQITIEIDIYSKEGIIALDHWVGIASSGNPLPINEYLLKGFDNKEMIINTTEEIPQDNLYLILSRSIHNVIQDYYTK